MSVAILEAIKEKKEQFPLLNRRAIEGQVHGILRNFREIKDRKYNRSVIYRQVGRDDYHQPSFIESLFDFWASVSFRDRERGQLMLAETATWDDWRGSFDEGRFTVVRDFWATEESIDRELATLRRTHLSGDVYGERAALLRIRAEVDGLLSFNNSSAVPMDAMAKAVR